MHQILGKTLDKIKKLEVRGTKYKVEKQCSPFDLQPPNEAQLRGLHKGDVLGNTKSTSLS